MSPIRLPNPAMPRVTDKVSVRMFGRVYTARVIATGKTRATVQFMTAEGREITKTLPVIAVGEWPRKNQACIWYSPPNLNPTP